MVYLVHCSFPVLQHVRYIKTKWPSLGSPMWAIFPQIWKMEVKSRHLIAQKARIQGEDSVVNIAVFVWWKTHFKNCSFRSHFRGKTRQAAISYPSQVLCMQARSHHWVNFCETTGNSSRIPTENAVSDSPEEGTAKVDDLVVKKTKKNQQKKGGRREKEKGFLVARKGKFYFSNSFVIIKKCR